MHVLRYDTRIYIFTVEASRRVLGPTKEAALNINRPDDEWSVALYQTAKINTDSKLSRCLKSEMWPCQDNGATSLRLASVSTFM